MNNRRNNKENPYSDIIKLAHHVSTTRPHMKISDRAAQFVPFSAVVGHDTATREAARYTEEKRELDDTQKSAIDDALRKSELDIGKKHQIKIIYFKADKLKAGGEYFTKIGLLFKIDKYKKEVHMMDGCIIPIDSIYNITTRHS